MECLIPIHQKNHLLCCQENYCYVVVDFITINRAIAFKA